MRKYDDVERLGKDEVEGILNGTCYIFEKIDGANVSLYWDDEKGLVICSRNSQVYSDAEGGNFRGIAEYIKRTKIREMVKDSPDDIFYGEWLVKHTIKYSPEITNHIWFFDIYNRTTERYVPYPNNEELFKAYDVKYTECMSRVDNPILEDLSKYLNVNYYKGEPEQEGIVIKNYSFVNKYGRQQWAKIVNERYKEVKRTPKDKSDAEEKLVEEYITVSRVDKIINKMKDEKGLEKLTEQNTGEVISRVYYDFIQEEIWDIIKKSPVIDFRKLKKSASEVVRNTFFGLIFDGGKK